MFLCYISAYHCKIRDVLAQVVLIQAVKRKLFNCNLERCPKNESLYQYLIRMCNIHTHRYMCLEQVMATINRISYNIKQMKQKILGEWKRKDGFLKNLSHADGNLIDQEGFPTLRST